MEDIINNLETLIDDIERDDTLTKKDILDSLYNIKAEAEDHQIEEQNHSIEWDDLVD
jgi:hypothetical protein